MTTAPGFGASGSIGVLHRNDTRAPRRPYRHTRAWSGLLTALALAPTMAQAQTATSSRTLTIDEALQTAFDNSPVLAAAVSRVEQSKGGLSGATRYLYNPTVEGGIAARRGNGQTSVDFDVGLGQQIELAGQRTARIDAAERALAAANEQLVRSKRSLAAGVHLAFIRALGARDVANITQRDVWLTRRLHEIAQLRLQRGSATELDVNVAAAELGRSEARFQAAGADYTIARAVLAEVMGLAPASLPLPAGVLQTDLATPPSLETLATAAPGARADLRALDQMERQSRAQHEVARAETWPDLTVRAFVAREDGTDTIIGGGIAIPLPVFNRNQGAVKQTRARIGRAAANRTMGELAAYRELVDAHARYRAGERTAARLRELVVGTLERNLTLLQRSFDAGKATWPEVVVIRRSLVDAQLQLVGAETQARRAWITLQVAAGRMPVPDKRAPIEIAGEDQ